MKDQQEKILTAGTKRLRKLEYENATLKKNAADLTLDEEMQPDVIKRKL
jgi:hypothetical protein